MWGKSLRTCLTILIFLVVLGTAATARTIYVDHDAFGANNGSSWNGAFRYLQDAFAIASTGDEIRVAHGIYKPDRGGGSRRGDRRATFQLINGVTIKGGYAGSGQPDPDARDTIAYETILSGDLNSNDSTVADPCELLTEGTRSENSYHVITGSGTNATAVLDGFTITGGNAPRLSGAEFGGGMYNQTGSPSLSNCKFTSNAAYYGGGGMCNSNSSSPTLTNCTFIENSADSDGGGMYNESNSSPTLNGCSFSRNWAMSFGGGMSNNYNSSPTLTDCEFTANVAGHYGGGMSNYAQSRPNLTNCTFTGNYVVVYGSGGMHNDRDSGPTLTNCTFRQNHVSDWGGGIGNKRSNPILTDCSFIENSAGDGGGGMNNAPGGSPILINCTFVGNSAGRGGGMRDAGTATLANCTFSRNSAGLWGGGFHGWDDSGATLMNCTFSGNSAPNGNALARNSFQQRYPSNIVVTNCILWDGGDEIWNNDGSIISVRYSDVQGGWPGQGNINTDPFFVNPNTGNYHLMPYSPCIDAGDPQSDYSLEPQPNGGRINMGRYGNTPEATSRGAVHMVTVPDVVGLSQVSAEATITLAGLSVGAVTYTDSTTVPAGHVITQVPVAGASLAMGSAVDLVISAELIPDYFTEQFTSGDTFDLSYKSILFTPTADSTFYSACLQEISHLPTSPAISRDLELGDDDYELVSLDDQKTVFIYGSSYSSFYVGSNGYITFTEGDDDYSRSLPDHFRTKRISGLFNDLNPSSGGTVGWEQFVDRVAVTWYEIPEYGMSTSNTFQIEMYFDGRIRLAWLTTGSQEGVVGLSGGSGLPADFQQTDLSEYQPCGDEPVVTRAIAGHVRASDGSGLSGVTLTFSDGGGSTTTAGNGYYSKTVGYGWSGVATPSKSGYVFNPRAISYSNVSSDMSDQDYIGSARPPQMDYFTEQFTSGADAFDLSYKSILFTPTGDGTFYSACLQEITQLPTDPDGGTDLGLGDDSYALVSLAGQETVSIFGSDFSSFYVGSNGYITFTEGDDDYSESLSAHFRIKRISGLFDDLEGIQGSNSGISYKQLADRVVVTWDHVILVGTRDYNTLQIEMYFDGRIQLAWLEVATQQGIVGLSDGFGLPEDFQETDLSGYPQCGDEPVIMQIISGHVQTSDGSGIGGVTLSFSNGGGSSTTDSSGYYSKTVQNGWSGVATPSKSGYTFDPLSRTYSNVTSDISDQHYTGSAVPTLDYFTEQFSPGADAFDLSNKSIIFTPVGNGTSYSACLQEITELPTGLDESVDLALDDDSYAFFSLTDPRRVSIFGSSFSSFYVSSNGYITFTEGDDEYCESLSEHFRIKRISGLFDDLDPEVSGTVSWLELADRVVVTWDDIAQHGTGNSNTFQIEMYFDGRIRLAWLAVAAQQGIVGLSNGLGLPAGFQETDFSTYQSCGNGSSVTKTISGYVRTSQAAGIGSVTLTFSNGGGSATTATNGYYSRTLHYGWSGVATPSKSGYIFEPRSTSYDSLTTDMSEQNYTGMTGPAREYFTEQFSAGSDAFDLSYKSVMFTPVGDGSIYSACLKEISQLPTDPVADIVLALGDDSYQQVSLDQQKTVSVFGNSFPSFYIGSNGYITFTEGDNDYQESLADHFRITRISALFNDFSPDPNGLISWKQLADRVAVTWQNVSEFRTSNSSTFQVEMYFDGRIQLAWLAIAAQDGIVGLSDGLGLPADFQETDLSAYQLCPAEPPIAHWLMDDNAMNTTVADSSGRGNHGTAQQNTFALSTTGKINRALSFNGAGDYISVPDNDDWTFSGDFTIVLWVKFDTFSPNWWQSAFLGHDEGPGEVNKWIFSYDPVSTRTVFHINGPGTIGPVITGDPWAAQAGIWYLVAVSRSGNTYVFYKDGVVNGSRINETVIPNAATPLIIGWAEGAGSLDGTMDDIRIYDRALSEAEISALSQP